MIAADTSALTHLTQAELLWVLPALFGSVVVPRGVYEEYAAAHPGVRPPWLTVERVQHVHPGTLLLDRGEAEAITLAHGLGVDLIIDERKGRQTATALGIHMVGTAAVLAQAYDAALIPSLGAALARMADTGFRLSARVAAALMQGRT